MAPRKKRPSAAKKRPPTARSQRIKQEKDPNKPDLKDPGQADRIRSSDYKEIYSNTIELSISQHDVRIKFLQVFGDKEAGHLGKILVEERGSVTLSHEHALRFRHVFANLVDGNIKVRGLTESDIELLKDSPLAALVPKEKKTE